MCEQKGRKKPLTVEKKKVEIPCFDWQKRNKKNSEL